MKTVSVVSSVLLISLIGSRSAAVNVSGASFTGLGDLAGGEFNSRAGNLSADGKFVTGTGTITDLNDEAFLWTQDTGMVGLGFARGTDNSSAFAVSNDGSKVVGITADPGGGAFNGEAIVWTAGSGFSRFDPFPELAVDPFPEDVSADGSVIVGTYRNRPSGDSIAFRWSGDGLTIIDRGSALGVSANGNVVVGQIDRITGILEAYRWTADGGAVGLGDLPGGETNSGAWGVSADGQVVVGVSESASGREAFRWTEAGGMVGLGDLPGGKFDSVANDTTADGSIVVGRSNVFNPVPPMISDSDPFIWDEAHGMRNLVDVLTNEYGLGDALAGWNLDDAIAISDDGTVIIGGGTNPACNYEAWIARLVPEPSTALLSMLAYLGLQLARRRRAPEFVNA
jgi:probable HAF family extracellular repeat protein